MILDTNAVSAMAAKEQAIVDIIAGLPSLYLPFIAYAESDTDFSDQAAPMRVSDSWQT